jgi:processive 1,2-diacylglycerol beta-glucosyltransferase
LRTQQQPRARQAFPRVLLCAADVGCGHKRAATAIELAMRSAHPGLRPKFLDALENAPRWFNHIYRDMYLVAAKHLPRFNGWLYDCTDISGTPADRGLAAEIEALAMRAFCECDSVRDADLIVCTHFLCARVLSRLRGRGELKAKLAIVVTDQHPHAVWRVPHADLFMVASQLAADEMARNGIDASRTIVTGIPIDWRFDKPMSQMQARFKQQLPTDGKIILLTGGGLGLGGIDQALDGILSADGDHYAVVVCGQNENLQKSLLSRIGRRFAHRCRIIGLTTKMHELMAAADLLVGKPGGLTTAEAAARGLPMVLLRPIPGQEERNAQVIVQSNAAVLYEDPFVAGQAAAALVHQSDVIDQMRRSAEHFGRAGSARAAAEASLALCSTRFDQSASNNELRELAG